MEVCKNVLRKYCKHIVHIRQQFHLQPQHLGIVLGAGASAELGFPGWEELVKYISETAEMKNFNFEVDNTKDVILNAQRLYEMYKSKMMAECDKEDMKYNRIEMIVRANWQRIVHSALYINIDKDIHKLAPYSSYLWSYIDIIKQLPMIVNYNFDDTIQRMLSAKRTEDEKETTRGYTTIWSSNVYVYPKNSVIYHPNGFLPFCFSEHPSEQLVFLEDSFADQLIESVNGKYNALSNYFTNNTCLLLGLSLSDPTLKHILRNNSLNYPGNYHYYIHYVGDSEKVNNKDAIIDANFDVYNLITLFLTKPEIKALAKLIKMNNEDFERIVEELGLANSYKYMIVGSVAVGKSTALSHFRSLATQDEWLESMPKHMTKDPNLVKEDNIDYIDKWVADQWGKKNYRLLRAKAGIHLIDRGPLDAFVFTKKGEWKEKAKLTIAGISPEKSNRKLCSTYIILLIGDPEVMAARALVTHRHTDIKQLDKQQQLLKYIYDFNGKGMKIIDTRNKGKNQVAKEIARTIFLEKYEAAPLDNRLKEIFHGSYPEPAESLF